MLAPCVAHLPGDMIGDRREELSLVPCDVSGALAVSNMA